MFLIQNFEFVLFALTLVGVALFHKQTMWVALTGMTLILVGAITTNILLDFPAAGVWAGILLGHACLCRRVRRINDMVRVISRCGNYQ